MADYLSYHAADHGGGDRQERRFSSAHAVTFVPRLRGIPPKLSTVPQAP
jgi:hypothetical protein